MPSAETHEYWWDTPVREIEGKENLGFLLAASGPVMAPVFWAHYADGLIEAIDPASGFPRPEPDPADRTKRVVIPVSLRTRPNIFQKQASRYSGQMRRVVQCLNSRGLESPFSYGWPKTHGIIEYPYPRQQGSTAGDEATKFAQRRFWIIEISTAGVFAAPITFGLKCMTCATNLTEYKDGDAINLASKYPANAKVLRVMDAAAIAPAYANGSPWYTGMGWAFSWSGRSASNVVQRIRSAPDHYETRLVDLGFSVAFTGSEITSLTAAGGIATALMADHGFKNGELVVISGATPDAYNGAHVITNATSGSFQFAIDATIPSPAGGMPKAANAQGTATISATISVGSAGRVTFRPNDLGTLWVPGGEQPTRWDGIRPFFNIVNSSGPVHVFYDGEDKLVTEWSMATTTIPEDKLLTPTLPSGVDSPLPPGSDQNALWAGVTEGFHYWADATEYIGPIVQMYAGSPYPDHPCMIKQRKAVVGSGHFYNSYIDLSWGFSGAVSASANAYGRRRIETETHFSGDVFHDAGFDYSNSGGYYPCGGGAGPCVGINITHTYSQLIQKTRDDATQSRTGSSSLVLFPLEREAVLAIRRIRESISTRSNFQYGYLRGVELRQEGYTVTPGCPFTNYVLKRAPIPLLGPASAAVVTNTQSNSMSYSLRASGGISAAGDIVDGASPNFDPFIVYQIDVKETADSSLFMMRGGLEYPDAGLTPGPANQIANNVKQLNDGYSLSGGFAALPTGRDPVAFIGQV